MEKSAAHIDHRGHEVRAKVKGRASSDYHVTKSWHGLTPPTKCSWQPRLLHAVSSTALHHLLDYSIPLRSLFGCSAAVSGLAMYEYNFFSFHHLPLQTINISSITA